MLTALDGLGVAVKGNTIVLLWGDHGWHLGEQNHWAKCTNFEHALHIPLIIVDPAGPPRSPGRSVPFGAGWIEASIVEAIDIYPTVASLLGIEVPPTCPVNSTLTKHCVDGRALLGAAAARGARELGGMPAGAVAYSQWAGKFAVGYTVRTSRYLYTTATRSGCDHHGQRTRSRRRRAGMRWWPRRCTTTPSTRRRAPMWRRIQRTPRLWRGCACNCVLANRPDAGTKCFCFFPGSSCVNCFSSKIMFRMPRGSVDRSSLKETLDRGITGDEFILDGSQQRKDSAVYICKVGTAYCVLLTGVCVPVYSIGLYLLLRISKAPSSL